MNGWKFISVRVCTSVGGLNSSMAVSRTRDLKITSKTGKDLVVFVSNSLISLFLSENTHSLSESVGTTTDLVSRLFAHFLICCMLLISWFTTNHTCYIGSKCVCVEHWKCFSEPCWAPHSLLSRKWQSWTLLLSAGGCT